MGQSPPLPDPTLVAQFLRHSPAFAALSNEARDALAALLTLRMLETTEILAEQGGPADALFLVASGSLSLERKTASSSTPQLLATVAPGEITGELSLLTGHPRAATIRAAQPATVLVLHKDAFDQLCAQFPAQMAPALNWMATRLHAYQVANAIAESSALRELPPEAQRDLAASFESIDLGAGTVLFREGEHGDALYLILAGRIRVEINLPAGNAAPAAQPQVLAELGKGDLLGEMALLTGESRSATAVAVRDSQLARLDRSAFDRVVAAYPQQMLSLVSRQLAGRLRAQNAGRKPEGRPPVSIAVLSLATPNTPSGAAGFARNLAQQLSAFGPTLHLNRTELARILGDDPWRPRRSNHPADSAGGHASAAAERRLLSWLGDQEMTFRHVVYEADPAASPWTARCLRQADALFVVSSAQASLPDCIQQLAPLTPEIPSSLPRTLVLVHDPATMNSPGGRVPPMPRNTAGWKHALGIPLHEHVRLDEPADVARIARAINRQSVGLALGGGFALGLAHIGVIDAMRHLNIPIDFVGGTSMGAIIGVACAQEFTHAQMLEVMDRGCAQALKGDLTLPVVSILTGRKVGLALGEYLEGMDIEDLWLPYFAISASLVHARMVVHRQGSALRSVLASCRAPGMFPPLEWDGDVLVDGGLVNNIPADVMRDWVGGGTVFAADVSPRQEFKAGAEFGMNLSGWRVAARNGNPFRRRQKIGTIGDILMRLIRLGGVAHDREIRAKADLYFSLPLDRFTIRDFNRGEEMATVGFDYAVKSLEAWMAEHGRPWLGRSGS